VHVLGKGCVGVVVAARLHSNDVALKIRRTDADRTTMKREATMLKIANSVGVGPRLIGTSENFLLMELLEGELIETWISHLDFEDRWKMVGLLRDILGQCFRLDNIGLDHGELNQARKHILIESRQPRIMDFESASTTRKTKNLSSLCQYLFVSSYVARRIETIIGKVDLKGLKKILAGYKLHRSIDSYGDVLHACRLIL
jgi:putative serine/threonine protein kinase